VTKTILILGFSGMLGSRITSRLIATSDVKIIIAGRTAPTISLFSELDFQKFDAKTSDLEALIQLTKPDFVINALGWIKQKDASSSLGLVLNSVIPAQLCELSVQYDFKLIHFSTDCVFDGSTGDYDVLSTPNPTDFYGQTKYLGEVSGDNVMCIRTSIIGYEINSQYSLLEWILSQRDVISGYSGAYFTGVSTNELSEFIAEICSSNFVSGLFHVASDSISKLELIRIVKSVYQLDLEIHEDHEVLINRGLVPNYHKLNIKWQAKNWRSKIEQIFAEGRLK
jgi:dTDP-4-dehydrorhamnose reductase